MFLGAFGDPGHAFPMIALGRALAARGHDVRLQTSRRWRPLVEGEGLGFAGAPEYHVFPDKPRPLKPYEAVVRAAREMEPLLEEFEPHAVVADILTLGPALAGERAGAPVATLIPHIYPVSEPYFPIYSIGARLPRTVLGRRLWQRLSRISDKGLAQGRDELNETRRRLGLAPLGRVHGGISSDLALVGTFAELEYPRRWPAQVRVVGPLMWEPPAEDVELPPGNDPLVLVAPSTTQDPDHRMLGAALRGLADAPVRVLATWNRRPPQRPLPVAPNTRLVEWVSYSRTMPKCDLVVCHAGHGTLVRALSSGCAVVACPVAGDMNENASRIDWAGVGVRLPARYIRPRPLRRAVERALADRERRRRAQQLASWAARHDSAARAAALVEELALARA
jgi:UDP:flavonoid glycosyltransferase YjiC (YdhE family)